MHPILRPQKPSAAHQANGYLRLAARLQAERQQHRPQEGLRLHQHVARPDAAARSGAERQERERPHVRASLGAEALRIEELRLRKELRIAMHGKDRYADAVAGPHVDRVAIARVAQLIGLGALTVHEHGRWPLAKGFCVLVVRDKIIQPLGSQY